MSSIALRVVSVILCISISACTSMRAIPDWRASSPTGTPDQHQGLSVGDEVLVTTVSGNQMRLIILSIETGTLVGYSHQHGYADKKDEPLRLPFEDIAKVERQQISWVKTSLAISAAALLALISALSAIHI